MVRVREGAGRQMVLLLLIIVAPDNMRVDRGDPAIAVFSIGYRPLGSRPPRSGLERSDFVLGRIARLQGSPRKGPESAL